MSDYRKPFGNKSLTKEIFLHKAPSFLTNYGLYPMYRKFEQQNNELHPD